jgi:tetratricopeptide (TPR) repeat protein
VLPERPEILDAAGRAQQAAEDYNQALATYGKLAALKPDSPLPYLRMAEVQVAAKNKEAALENLQKALKVKPDSLEAQRGIMLLDLDAGRSKEALRSLVKCRSRDPRRPSATFSRVTHTRRRRPGRKPQRLSCRAQGSSDGRSGDQAAYRTAGRRQHRRGRQVR